MVESVMNYEEVVIIGAGICGLATALALHKKGIKSVVMERSETLRNTTGAGIGIRGNGWRALDQLGVADILRQTSIPIQRIYNVSLDDNKIQESSMDDEGRVLRRKDLIDTLYEALPPSTVKFGFKLESIKLDPITSKPIIRFINGTSITAKVLIGCDGCHSVVADFLNLKPTKMLSFCGARGLTNYPNGHSFGNVIRRFLKGENPTGVAPVDDKSVYWFVGQPYAPKGRIWEDPEVIRESTLDLLKEFPLEVQELVKHADAKTMSFAHLRYRAPWDLVMEPFRKGTVTVAGDAMHVMGPFLGQGGSAGLEDAVVLARNLAQTDLNRHVESEKKVTVEEALDVYVKDRRMRLIWLSLQTYLTGTLVDTKSRIKKFMCIALLLVLFRNQNGHTEYDCGEL